MKRYNFLKYQAPEEGTAPAVSRTTTTKPVDYVGELRVTRFKLSRGTLPIGFIEPSKRGFTEEQVRSLAPSNIPTDIEMLVFCERDVEPVLTIPNNGAAYIILNNTIRGFFHQAANWQSIKINISTTAWSVYSYVAIPGNPIWKKETDGQYYLQNESIPFYSWSDFHNKTIWMNFAVTNPNVISSPTFDIRLIENADGKPKFYIRMNALLNNNSEATMNPSICFNDYARQIFGLDVGEMPSVNFDMPAESAAHPTWGWAGYTVGDNLTFYVPPMSYDWNPQMQLMIQTRTKVGDMIFNMDCTYTPIVQTLPENYFPLSHIIITADELNFQGESICVDTTKKQGVVDPSSLTILKSFYVGLTDSFLVSTSDFIYINDSRDNEPVIVNSPRQVSLTIRIWLVTKEGNLTPLILNPGSSFSIQLSLQ